MKGSHFDSGKETLYLDTVGHSSILGTATVGTSGSFSSTVKIAGIEAGSHTIIAQGTSGNAAKDGDAAVRTFTVSTLFSLSATTAPPGGSLTATLKAFQPGELVTFHWGSTTGPVVGSTIATAGGAATGTIKVPKVSAATVKIYAVGLYGSCIGRCDGEGRLREVHPCGGPECQASAPEDAPHPSQLDRAKQPPKK